MNKPKRLREHLERAIPWLKQNPDKMLVLIPSGNLFTTGTGGLSFENKYTLELILMEYPHSADTVFVPLLAWLRTDQPDLLQNPKLMEGALTFEAEFIAHDKVDISVKLKLDERVKVTESASGVTVEHLPEPQSSDWFDWDRIWQI